MMPSTAVLTCSCWKSEWILDHTLRSHYELARALDTPHFVCGVSRDFVQRNKFTTVISDDENREWGEVLFEALNVHLKGYTFVVVLLDDFVIEFDPKIKTILGFIDFSGVEYLRLSRSERFIGFRANQFMMPTRDFTPYVSALQPSMIKIAYMKELLQITYSPWHFEFLGDPDKCLYLGWDVIKYKHLLERGKLYWHHFRYAGSGARFLPFSRQLLFTLRKVKFYFLGYKFSRLKR